MPTSVPLLAGLDSGLTAEVLVTQEQFERIAGEWQGLFAASRDAAPFLSYEWVSLFVSRLEAGEQLFVVLVREEGALVGVGPFKARRRALGTVVLPIATGVAAYAGVLTAQDRLDVVDRMAGAIGDRADVDLLYMPLATSTDVRVWVLLTQLANRRFTCRWWPREVSPFIRNPGGASVYLSRKSGKSRQGMQREERKLEQDGPVTVEHLSGREIDESILRRLDAIQRRSWQQRRYGVTSIGQPWEAARHLAMAQAGLAEVFILRVGEADSAFILNYRHGDNAYAIVTAFVESQGNRSPGKCLWRRVVTAVLDRGDALYDLLFGITEYKRFWCTQSHHVVRWVAYRGVRGWVLSWAPHRIDASLARHPALRARLRAGLRLLRIPIQRQLLR